MLTIPDDSLSVFERIHGPAFGAGFRARASKVQGKGWVITEAQLRALFAAHPRVEKPVKLSPPPGQGLGDAVERRLRPIARLVDRLFGTRLSGCTACSRRRAWLNRMMPDLSRPLGLGDVVAAIVQPIARVIDALTGKAVANCGGCTGRKEQLNAAVPDIRHPFKQRRRKPVA